MMLTATIVLLLINLVNSQKPSPCPHIFTYEYDNQEEDRWYGNITIRLEERIDAVWLKITLDKPADSFGSWFGDATANDLRVLKIKKASYDLEEGDLLSIRFFVKYNLGSSVPSLRSIIFNGDKICDTAKFGELTPNQHSLTTRKPKTTTSVRPTVATPVYEEIQNDYGDVPYNPPSDDQGESNDNIFFPEDTDYFLGDFNLNKLKNKPRALGPAALNDICGTVVAQALPLISNALHTFQGQWPWHVAIYYAHDVDLTYTCGGTLVSQEHIITAAHCVTQLRTTKLRDINTILVYLGKHELRKFGHKVQDMEVSKIFVHPQYNPTKFYNDIAILKLESPAEITNNVRPCCLWEGDYNIEPLFNKKGMVVGWGFDENMKISESLMEAQMPIVPDRRCIWSHRSFFSDFTHVKKFCAGYGNGTTVCNGDSGGGMFFRRANTSSSHAVWQLRGLVSVGVALQNQGSCDTSHFSLFTDVAKYQDWIKKIIYNKNT